MSWDSQRIGDVGEVESLASGGFGYVAAGSNIDADGSGGPAIWISSDATDWALAIQSPDQFQRLPAERLEGGGLGTHGVISTRSGLVAVANDLGPGFGVWQSEDGSRWERVFGVPGVCDEDYMCRAGAAGNPWVTATETVAWPQDLAVVGSRLVLAGGACTGEPFACYPAVWTSDDEGGSWSRLIVDGFYGTPAMGGLAGHAIGAFGAGEGG